MTLVELLRRLRRHGVPGAALAAGVPVDTRAEIAAELEPVFRALEPTFGLTHRIRASAAAEADQMLERATGEAARLLEEARLRAPEVAAAETASQLRQVGAERRRLLAAAEAEAERVASVAALRSPQLAERIVQLALDLPRTGAGP